MFEKLKKADQKLYYCYLAAIALCVLGGIVLFIDSGNTWRGFDIDNANILWILVGLIGAAYIALDYYLAGLFYFLGVDKGYSEKAYLWIAYFLPLVGYMLVIAMPDRRNTQQIASDELPDL